MSIVYIGVGSNIDPIHKIPAAFDELSALGIRVTATSRFYRTEPIDRPEQDHYANGVWRAETDTTPVRLKALLREVERRHGRVRGIDKYAPRSIDLDILLFDELILRSDELIIPDPHILERPFLARCLLELAPDISLPGSGRRIAVPPGGPPLEEYDEIARVIRKKLEVTN